MDGTKLILFAVFHKIQDKFFVVGDIRNKSGLLDHAVYVAFCQNSIRYTPGKEIMRFNHFAKVRVLFLPSFSCGMCPLFIGLRWGALSLYWMVRNASIGTSGTFAILQRSVADGFRFFRFSVLRYGGSDSLPELPALLGIGPDRCALHGVVHHQKTPIIRCRAWKFRLVKIADGSKGV